MEILKLTRVLELSYTHTHAHIYTYTLCKISVLLAKVMSYYMNSDIGVINDGNQQFNLHLPFHYPFIMQERQAKVHCMLSPEK